MEASNALKICWIKETMTLRKHQVSEKLQVFQTCGYDAAVFYRAVLMLYRLDRLLARTIIIDTGGEMLSVDKIVFKFHGPRDGSKINPVSG
jgi:hypothetical protein